MKEKMSSKQEMARLTIASVAVLLAGLLTTPLMSGTPVAAPAKTVAESKTPVLRKLSNAKSAASAKPQKSAKRLMVADHRSR